MSHDAPTHMDAPDRAFALDNIALLAGLTGAERARVARSCGWRRWAPHQQLFGHGSESREICFIVAGRVRVVNYSAGGREVSFADIAAGGTVGELSAIDGGPRSASVFALDDTLTASLGAGPFRRLVAAHLDIAFTIMQKLAAMVRDADRRIMDLSTLGAPGRVHGELLRLACDHAVPNGGAVIEPAPLHAEIAARAGTTRETVARALGALARDGIAVRRGGALAIPDIGRLAALVGAACCG